MALDPTASSVDRLGQLQKGSSESRPLRAEQRGWVPRSRPTVKAASHVDLEDDWQDDSQMPVCDPLQAPVPPQPTKVQRQRERAAKARSLVDKAAAAAWDLFFARHGEDRSPFPLASSIGEDQLVEDIRLITPQVVGLSAPAASLVTADLLRSPASEGMPDPGGSSTADVRFRTLHVRFIHRVAKEQGQGDRSESSTPSNAAASHSCDGVLASPTSASSYVAVVSGGLSGLSKAWECAAPPLCPAKV